jgi:hypothetical protein
MTQAHSTGVFMRKIRANPPSSHARKLQAFRNQHIKHELFLRRASRQLPLS